MTMETGSHSYKAESFRKNDGNLAALALSATQDGLWDWNRISGRVFYDHHWKVLAGFGDNQLSDSIDEWFSRIHPEDRKTVQDKIEAHVSGKTACFRTEHRLLHADDNYRWVLVRGAALRNAEGYAERLLGTITDINARKQEEIKLHTQLDEMRFALASEKVLMEELDRKNRELVELSITDGLTGLYNHRFLQQRFDFEFKRTRRYGGELSCLLMDIDHFKKLNDTYGHQFGDYVLKQIASIIKSHSREVDICGRYGGEEFLVIANLNETNAVQFARKLHDAIETETFEHPSAVVKVTVSIGIAECNNEVKTKQELIERADRAMYKAKRDGRNLVRVWKDVQADAVLSEQNGVEELRGKFQELSLQMQGMYVEAIGALVKAVEAREPDAVYHHSENVARYAVEIARRMKLPDDQIEVIKFGALLHDIGKISIPDSILMKNGPLPAEEQLILNRHPEVGVSILKDIRFLEKEITVVLYHHERYDGSGFPHGLCKHEIPVGARIVAVADAYDRMLHGRGGSDRKTEDEACTLLKENREKLFSPEVVDAFLETI